MKTRIHRNQMFSRALLFAALAGGMFAPPASLAQPAAQQVVNRCLLVFDTSAEMKRRVPAVQKALNALLADSMNGELRPNDTIGVWTFDQELRVGQFPLQRWEPGDAAVIASNITAFVAGQRYSKKTRMEALIPRLNQLARSSGRLTVVIFCDGYGEVHGTPYDSGINQIFQQRYADRQKARLPIAIALRSQLGQYVDCIVSFPPRPVSLPAFPPLPLPPPPKPAPAPPPPRPAAPPLIIIGTPPTNRAPPPRPAATNPPPVTETPTSAPPVVQQEPLPVEGMPMRTGAAPTRLTIAPTLLPQTNALAPTAGDSGAKRKGMRAPGVVLLVVVAFLVELALGRAWPKKKI